MYNGRIARFDAPNQPFTVERVHLDEVRRGEILIKVKRANICGSDLHAWHGGIGRRRNHPAVTQRCGRRDGDGDRR